MSIVTGVKNCVECGRPLTKGLLVEGDVCGYCLKAEEDAKKVPIKEKQSSER